MKITSATVVRYKHSADVVFLHTDLPSPIFPFDGNLSLKFSSAKNSGEGFVKAHFPEVEIKIVNDN